MSNKIFSCKRFGFIFRFWSVWMIIKCSRHVICMVYVLAVFAVFFDGRMKLAFCASSQGMAEASGDTLNFRNSGFDFGVVVHTARMDGRIISFKESKELTSESGSSLVELFDLPVLSVSAFSEPMFNEYSGEISSNSACSKGDSWVKGYHVNSLLLGFTIGGWLAIFICDIYPKIRFF